LESYSRARLWINSTRSYKQLLTASHANCVTVSSCSLHYSVDLNELNDDDDDDDIFYVKPDRPE